MIRLRALPLCFALGAALAGAGCAVQRGQESVGNYIDDATVTTQVKARFASDPTVSAMSIGVTTLKGVVQLSGFAQSTQERDAAVQLARTTPGVIDVRDDIIVRK